MKSLKILFLVLTPYLFSNCTKNENPIPSDLIGDWKVISFDDNVAMTKVYKTSNNTWPDFNNGDNTASFSKSSLTSGDISGRNVTNSFTAKYEISPGNKIVLTDGFWTEINEPVWGRLFHSISSAETFEVYGDNLIIFYNQKKNSITLERVKI
jgi:hypothetical protein